MDRYAAVRERLYGYILDADFRSAIALLRSETEQNGSGVDGAIFASEPRLVAEVGGDGTCANAMEAPDLFERLLATVKR